MNPPAIGKGNLGTFLRPQANAEIDSVRRALWWWGCGEPMDGDVTRSCLGLRVDAKDVVQVYRRVLRRTEQPLACKVLMGRLVMSVFSCAEEAS